MISHTILRNRLIKGTSSSLVSFRSLILAARSVSPSLYLRKFAFPILSISQRSFHSSPVVKYSTGTDSTDPSIFNSQVHLPPPTPSHRGYTKLTNRSIIAVGGPEASKFLNGVVTSKIVSSEDAEFDDANAIYTSFLNSKGRILADSFLYPIHCNKYLQDLTTPLLPEIKLHGKVVEDVHVEYLIDCDAEVAENLFKSLKLYKLRASVAVAQVPSELLSIWSVWDDTSVSEAFPLDNAQNPDLFNLDAYNFGAYPDLRTSGFGIRLILPSDKTPLDVLSQGVIKASPALEDSPLTSYNIRRILYGIPEGAQELPPTRALPLESCIDFMGGINFNKGCYVGQELTIRSHHHGVVRKRIIPVVFYPNSSNSDEVEIDLSYDPSSPIATEMNTSTCLVGSSIVDLTPRVSKAAGNSPFASSPFASNESFESKATVASRPIGSIIAAIGNVGLALVRLEQFAAQDAKPAINVPNSKNNLQHYICVRGFQPFWWPQPEE